MLYTCVKVEEHFVNQYYRSMTTDLIRKDAGRLRGWLFILEGLWLFLDVNTAYTIFSSS